MKSSKCKILKPKNPPQKCQLQISDVKVCTVFGVSSIYLRKESVPFGIHRATIPSFTKTGPACWRHGHILNQVDHAK